MSVAIVFDIGGTQMRVGVSRDGKEIEHVKVQPTPKDFKEGVTALRQAAHDLAAGETIREVSGCIAGIFERGHTALFRSPNLPGWERQPIRTVLEEAFRTTVYLENDAALAGLGESIFGSGKDFYNVMYMTVSTGVGGARIIGREVDSRVYSFEPGQQIIDTNKNIGLEDLISGTAIQKRFGKKAFEIKQSDPVWKELAVYLAHGLYNSVLHWSPDVIVLGGSMILGDPSIPIREVEKELGNILKIFPTIPVIRKSSLGDHSGLYGALKFISS